MKWITWPVCIMNGFSCCQWEAQPIKHEISWPHWGQNELITWERSLPRSELSFLTLAHNAPVLLGCCFYFPPKSLPLQLIPSSRRKGTSFRIRFPKKLTLLRCASHRLLNAQARTLCRVIKTGNVSGRERDWGLGLVGLLFPHIFSSHPFLHLFSFSVPLLILFLFTLIDNSPMTAITGDGRGLPFSMVDRKRWCLSQKTQVMSLFQEWSDLHSGSFWVTEGPVANGELKLQLPTG